MPERTPAIDRLLIEGLLRADGEQLEPTPRWRGAVARATLYLIAIGEEGDDLRIPFAAALVEHFGEEAADHELAEMVELMIQIDRLPRGVASGRERPTGR
jgi:hypothetical protein